MSITQIPPKPEQIMHVINLELAMQTPRYIVKQTPKFSKIIACFKIGELGMFQLVISF